MRLCLDARLAIWQGQFVGTFKDSGRFCWSTLQQGSLSTVRSSSVIFLRLCGGTHVGKANGINMKRCCIRLWHLPKLLSPGEHTHPPVGRLKRAIDSSKKSQIKTHLQTVGKKQLLHKVMSRGLPHESEKLSKEL